MIGAKKLKTIRDELQRAMADTSDDPIQWLEDRLTAQKRSNKGNEVLQSLQRILKKRKSRVGTK